MSADQINLSSENDENFFTTLLKEYPIRTAPLTNVVILTGQATYETWAIFMITIWKTMGLFELVVEGRKPVKSASREEIRAYTVLYNSAIGVILQVVCSDILKVILEQIDPHLMWKYITVEYKRDNAYALVYQLGSLCQLYTTYSASETLSQFLQQFETEWNKLYRLARDPNEEYRQDFANFLQKDLVKRDFLLGFLSRYQKNVVDNLTTKSNLTFAAAKQHLLDTDYEEAPNSALITGNPKSKKPVLSRPSGISKKLPCSYCKKHYPKSNPNHPWYKCLRLKADKNKRRNNDNGNDNNDSALMTTTNEENGSSASRHVPAL